MDLAMRDNTVAISTLTEGEVLFGIAKNPAGAARLRAAAELLLPKLRILAWDSAAARAYGPLRAKLYAAGRPLSAVDMLIAAHALSVDAVLVTHDNVFKQVEGLRTVDWATDL